MKLQVSLQPPWPTSAGDDLRGPGPEDKAGAQYPDMVCAQT